MIDHFPPQGTRSTGLHVVDSASWQTAMRHCLGDGESPYARPSSPYGTHHPSLYILPHYHIYGLIGRLGRFFHAPELLWLACANGLSLGFMLWAAHRLLLVTVPELANTAFLIFALGGGAGGLLYWACFALGWSDSPSFTAYFERHFIYELTEGAQFQPWLLPLRLYYTFPMGLIFAAFSWMIPAFQRGHENSGLSQASERSERDGTTSKIRDCTKRASAASETGLSQNCSEFSFFLSLPVLSLACWANARFVGPTLMLGLLWLLLKIRDCPKRASAASETGLSQNFERNGSKHNCFLAALSLGLFCLASAVWVALLARSRPELTGAVPQDSGPSIWLTAFLSAALFQLPLAVAAIWRSIQHMPVALGTATRLLLGYLGAFFTGIILYYLYYGNWLACYDATAAVWVSDWTPLFFFAGMLLWRPIYRHCKEKRGIACSDESSSQSALLAWYGLWFLCLFCLGTSAFGEGAFVEFARYRVKVWLGLPMAVLVAAALQSLGARYPRVRGAWLTLLVTSGLLSMSVAWGVTHGPLGYGSLQRQYPWVANMYMTETDARMLEQIPHGVVLAPSLGAPLFGDILAQRPGYATVYGNPTLDFSREPAPELRARVADFFKPGTPEPSRKELVESWPVDFVYCPHEPCLPPDTLQELRGLPWLKEMSHSGKAVLFSVTP